MARIGLNHSDVLLGGGVETRRLFAGSVNDLFSSRFQSCQCSLSKNLRFTYMDGCEQRGEMAHRGAASGEGERTVPVSE
jgi:hypothetical protein